MKFTHHRDQSDRERQLHRNRDAAAHQVADRRAQLEAQLSHPPEPEPTDGPAIPKHYGYKHGKGKAQRVPNTLSKKKRVARPGKPLPQKEYPEAKPAHVKPNPNPRPALTDTFDQKEQRKRDQRAARNKARQ